MNELFTELDSKSKLLHTEYNKNTICDVIYKFFNTDNQRMNADSRKTGVVRSRYFMAFFLNRYTSLTLPSIGEFLGKRSHSSAIHMINSFVRLYKKDKLFKEQADKVFLEIESNITKW